MAKKSNEQLDAELQEALAQITGLQTQYSDLLKVHDELGAKTAAVTTLNEQLQSKVLSLEAEITYLTGCNDRLQEDLVRASGGAVRRDPEAEAIKPDAEGFPESAILAKTRAGLNRKQAIQALVNQREHDAALAAAAN